MYIIKNISDFGTITTKEDQTKFCAFKISSLYPSEKDTAHIARTITYKRMKRVFHVIQKLLRSEEHHGFLCLFRLRVCCNSCPAQFHVWKRAINKQPHQGDNWPTQDQPHTENLKNLLSQRVELVQSVMQVMEDVQTLKNEVYRLKTESVNLRQEIGNMSSKICKRK